MKLLTTLLVILMFSSSQITGAAIIEFEYLGSFGRGSLKTPGEFNYPSGIGVDPSTGDVYVMDNLFQRIQRFDKEGNYITHWKCSGGLGVAVDPSSHSVYVAFPNSHKIKKYDPSGKLIKEWGGYGTAPGMFNTPREVAVNPINSHVFVIDSGNKRVQEFDNNGNFIKAWSGDFHRPYGISIGTSPADPSTYYVYVANTGSCNILKYDSNGNLIKKWGELGSEPGKLRWPRGISVDQKGYVYVADSDMERVQVFDSEGNFIKIIKGPHNLEAGPFHPRAVDVNPVTGDIYVAASYAHRIDRFNSQGDYEFSWGHHEKDGAVFNNPSGIAVNPKTGEVYVADTQNHIIKVFSKEGNFKRQFGFPPEIDRSKMTLDFPAPIAIDGEGNLWGINRGIYYPDDPSWGSDKYIRKFDKNGNFISGFAHPDFWEGMNGLAIDVNTGDIYVVNTPKNKIMKFDSFGNLLLEFGTQGDGPGEFIKPAGIALDLLHKWIYIVDTGNERIQKFDMQGQFLMSWGESGDGPGEFNFNSFSGIALDIFGNIYVADSKNGRIQVFDPYGNYITEIGSYGWGDGKFAWPASVAINEDKLYVLDTGGNEVEIYKIIHPVPISNSFLLFSMGFFLMSFARDEKFLCKN